MIERLALVIHWVGFLCLPLSLLFVEEVLDDGGNGYVFWMMIWIILLHWPIKFILTGNKAIFPWQTKYSWTLQKGIHASENED
jgi:hypothetical protein